jgi:chromosome segregation ATPase
MALLFLPAFVLLCSNLQADDRQGDQNGLSDQKKLQTLLRELERAREEGEPEKEEKISREIKRVEESRASRQDREADDRSSEDLIDRIAQLRKDAIRAKREGNADRAKEAWSEADKLESDLRGQMERDRKGRGNRPDRRDPKVEESLREIKEKARALTQEGKGKAKELQAKANELAAKAKALAKEGQEEQAQDLRREAEEVRAKAETIAREFQERAEKFRREAEEKVQERSRNGKGPRKENAPAIQKPPAPRPPKGDPGLLPPQPPNFPPLPNGFNAEPREDLRQEIDRLRSEVRDLRDLLKRSLEEKPRRDQPEKSPPGDQQKSF